MTKQSIFDKLSKMCLVMPVLCLIIGRKIRMKYETLNKTILENVGGKENITGLTHCITRLRFKLKDESKANTNVLKNTDGVVTVIQSGGQYQVVIGNHVPDVYNEFVELAGLSNSVDSEEVEKKGGIFDTFIDLISSIFTPTFAVLIGAGMIKGLLAVLTATAVLDRTGGTYLILNAAGDGLFYFFPIFLGHTAAKKFKVNPFIGMGIGAALVYPTFAAASANAEPLYILFKGTLIESPVYITFMGLPVVSMTYTQSVIPVIFAAYLASKLQALFNKIVPTVLKNLMVPFLVLIVTVPLTFLIVGPVTTWAGNLIGQGLSTLYAINPVISGILIGGFWPVFIMFGLHWGFVPIALNNYATLGYDIIMMSGLTTPLATAGATLAIFLKTKNKALKELSLPAVITAIFGITEPAIYGVTLPRKKAFISTMVSVGVGGAILGFFKSKVFINGGTGIFALPRFIDPQNGITNSFIGIVVASVVAFVLAFVLTFLFGYKASDDEEITVSDSTRITNTKNLEMTSINSPIQGVIIPLSDIKDEAFAGELLGKGVGILPTDGQVFAPEDGTITVVFPTNHAVGLTLKNGVEVLIHIGMDTVNLAGEAFESFVKQGQFVKKGDLLIKFDIDKITDKGYSIETPVIITNTKEYLDVLETSEKSVTIQDVLLTIAK